MENKDKQADNPSLGKHHISNNKELLLVSLAKFYSNKTYQTIVTPIIDGDAKISLRLIDWFVTNYAKKNATIITKTVDNNVVHFNVYLSYRSQLKAYSKHLFDPFRRRDRIVFYFGKGVGVETTIGQLNFFRWLIQNDVLEYIDNNMEAIESDMLKTQKENSLKRNDEENIKVKVITDEKTGETVVQRRKKRSELSKSFANHMNTLVGQHTISFD